MHEEQQPGLYSAGSVARPAPGESVPLSVVERLAEMLAAQWRQFGDRWDQQSKVLDQIQAELGRLGKASHDAPCEEMREHKKWHEEQTKEIRALRRAILLAVLAAGLACLSRLIV